MPAKRPTSPPRVAFLEGTRPGGVGPPAARVGVGGVPVRGRDRARFPREQQALGHRDAQGLPIFLALF